MSARGYRTWAKPTDDQVRRFLRMIRDGCSVREAGEAASIKGGTATRIVKESGGVTEIRRGET